MSEPYIGQIIFGAFGFAPRGYALCDGATLLINQNQALYSLISHTYGGDGQNNFKLPDLRGRVAMGFGLSPESGTVYPIGQYGGNETVALTAEQLPPHSHHVGVSNKAGTVPASSNIPAQTAPNSATSTATKMYGPVSNDSQLVRMADQTISHTGGGAVDGAAAAHSNMQPFVVASAAIALSGTYPSRY